MAARALIVLDEAVDDFHRFRCIRSATVALRCVAEDVRDANRITNRDANCDTNRDANRTPLA